MYFISLLSILVLISLSFIFVVLLCLLCHVCAKKKTSTSTWILNLSRLMLVLLPSCDTMLRFTWYGTLACGSNTRPSLHRLPWCPLSVHRMWPASASFLCLMCSAPACSPNMWYQKDMHRSVSGAVMGRLARRATFSSSSPSSPVLLGKSESVSCM